MSGHEIITDNFVRAAADYRYLVERGYTRKTALKLTGDRYALTKSHRIMLYRGVFPGEESERRSRILMPSRLAKTLAIDGYNVLITLTNYLYGRPVFLGTDSFLRDAGQAYGSVIRGPLFEQAVELLIGFLESAEFTHVSILFDQPVPKSGELAAGIREKLATRGLEGTAATVRSPDFELKHFTGGAVCTSDSAVIDGCSDRVCDLAREVLDTSFSPDYIDLANLFSEA